MISNTIESVCKQSYTNIEYIIIDGGSTDNTLDILEVYKRRGKLIYISRKDKGMYYAINEGMRMASGDIVAYLNSDDLYFPWTVQKAVEAFQKNKDADMVYGDSMVWDIIKNKKYLNIYASHRRYWLTIGGILCQPTVFLRRQVLERVGFFNTDFKYLADCEFWNRVNNHLDFNISKVDEIMAVECNHDNTFRTTVKSEILKEKNELLSIYGYKDYKKYLSPVIKIITYIQREIKILKFALRASSNNNNCNNISWNNFLGNYIVHFKYLNYILCKLFHNRVKFPRFSIVEKEK